MTTTPPEPPAGGDPGYGTPPPPPGYGAGGGYGTPPAYGGPGYGGGAPAAPGQWAGPPLASWGERATAFTIDYFGPAVVAGIVQNVISPSLGTLLWLAALGWGIYNAYLQGQTGQSTGKKQAGIRLLREVDGQPIGGGAGIGRFFLHIVDGLPCYLGFLWPLWDAKKQTFADKIMKTVNVKG